MIDETQTETTSRHLPVVSTASTIERFEQMALVFFGDPGTAIGHDDGDLRAPWLGENFDGVSISITAVFDRVHNNVTDRAPHRVRIA